MLKLRRFLNYSLITIIFTLTFILILSLNVMAKESSLNVITVNSFDDTSNIPIQKFLYSKGEISNSYTFTLEKRGYVQLYIKSEVGFERGNKAGTIRECSVLSKDGLIMNSDRVTTHVLSYGGYITRYLLLDAGTYTIKMNRDVTDSYVKETQGYVYFYVMTKPVESDTENNTSPENAFVMKNGKTYSGFLTCTTRDEYYCFTLMETSDVNISFMQTSFLSTKVSVGKPGVGIYNAETDACFGSVLLQKRYDIVYTKSYVKLKKGTYYIRISGDYRMSNTNLRDTSFKTYAETQLSVSWVGNDNDAPDKPVIKKAMAGTKIVKGTGEPDSTVTVVHKGKKYTSTVNKKGRFKVTVGSKLKLDDYIKVYLKDYSKNKSKKEKVLIKAHKIAKPTLIKIQTGTSYIEGYSIKPNCKVTVQIGKKTYIKNSNNDGYFNIKVPVKLKESTNAKVKIEDKWGNYSRYRKVSFI